MSSQTFDVVFFIISPCGTYLPQQLGCNFNSLPFVRSYKSTFCQFSTECSEESRLTQVP